MMALDNTTKPPPKPPKRCEILRCRIVCYEIPYFGENEDQIIKAVAVCYIDRLIKFITLLCFYFQFNNFRQLM